MLCNVAIITCDHAFHDIYIAHIDIEWEEAEILSVLWYTKLFFLINCIPNSQINIRPYTEEEPKRAHKEMKWDVKKGDVKIKLNRQKEITSTE